MIALLLFGYSFLGLYEFIPLYKQKHWRDFWVNTILGICSFTIGILQCFDIKIPNPSEPIKDIVTLVFGKWV
ncbi:hypothetical protein [Neobacillus sp. PS3-40]|uniref:hypothetical protein n=1 Tax=Neobacillus sp. PS3-40 TaxID=3070679 RepID=UPI0027E2150F|nr:hypothetical protein [Neobacillus sp. PS3-40]WML44756.1 hypothetical protein RCG20_02280 [Neobacillus sp. PS3-40]